MDENVVVAALREHLEDHGYRIEQCLRTTEQGVDIIATKIETGRGLVVEAKGATSSFEGSARFGMPFTPSQVFDRVAKGVFTTLKLRADYPDRPLTDVALAVPDLPGFRRHLEHVQEQLAAAGLRVFLVAADLTVSELY